MSVIVKLQGGLGNQMFQYAFGHRISKITQKQLILDLSFLNRRDLGSDFTYRNYDLDIFFLDSPTIVNGFNEDYDLIEESFNPNITERELNIFVDGVLSNKNENIYLDGYWASPKYFGDYNFRFKNNVLDISQELLYKIQQEDSVMLNVRRTDFLNNDFHGVLDKKYIMKGVNKIKSFLKNPKFYIFSDDINWCIEHLNDIPNSFIVDHEHKGDKFSNYLLLMSECKHFVIPNSTFAWWSAFMSKNNNKKVLYPKTWLNGLNSECKMLYYGLDWQINE
jgi:hypothetical protein